MRPPADAIHRAEASITIDAPPEAIYDMVSDITRMGEWSPEATGGAWLDGTDGTPGSGAVGDWFRGDNNNGEREWSRECQVARADRGHDFTFVVAGVDANCTWWSYEMEPDGAGTRLTERWWMVNLTPGMQAATPEQRAERVALTPSLLDATLAGIKQVAEAG